MNTFAFVHNYLFDRLIAGLYGTYVNSVYQVGQLHNLQS